MDAPSQADLTWWLEQGWREVDRKSPEGKMAFNALTSDARKSIQRHGRSFKRGRVPILARDGDDSYLVIRGEQQPVFVRKLAIH